MHKSIEAVELDNGNNDDIDNDGDGNDDVMRMTIFVI